MLQIQQAWAHFFSFTQNLGNFIQSSSEHNSPLVLHSMTHEKAGSQSPYVTYQFKFYPVCVQIPELEVSIAFSLIKHF